MRGLLLSLLLVPLLGHTAGSSTVPLRDADVDLRDIPSLQRGAQLYVTYCLGCHSLRFQRYERTADDLQIPHDIALEMLVPAGGKIGDLMTSAIPQQSKNWFGGPPPDLTMVTRVRSPDWVFTYLTGFYLDESRPFRVNNTLFENVGMPHVLGDLQGRVTCEPVTKQVAGRAELRDPLLRRSTMEDEAKKAKQPCVLARQAGSGNLQPAEFDAAVRDIVNFLYYVGEPTRLDRQRIGVYVLLFLAVLFTLAWLLNREYWKDIH